MQMNEGGRCDEGERVGDVVLAFEKVSGVVNVGARDWHQI